MKKFAIYTACIGGYDDIAQPPVVSDQFDYFVFSDHSQDERCGIWKIISAPIKDNMSPIFWARYIKTHPHELLPQYDAWIWVDTNLLFADNFIYNKFADWYNGSALVAACPHPATDDVYEHIYEMCCFGFEKDIVCLQAMKYLQEHNYPAHHGLCETGILFRKNISCVTTFDERWWWHIQNLSKRDQFSFNYVLYVQQIQWESILPQNEPIRQSPHIIYNYHANIASKRKVVKLTQEENIRHYVRKQHPAIYVPFVEKYKKISLHNNYPLRLRIWGWYMFPLYVLNPLYTYRLIKRKITKFHTK